MNNLQILKDITQNAVVFKHCAEEFLKLEHQISDDKELENAFANFLIENYSETYKPDSWQKVSELMLIKFFSFNESGGIW